MIPDSVADALMRSIEKDNQEEEEKRFAIWCDELLALPNDFKWQIKDDRQADLEL